MRSPTILHREFHNLGRAILISVPTMIGALVAAGSGDTPMSGWRTWVGFVSIFGLFFCAMAWGIYRMNRITLTHTELRVGNETFNRGDLDFAFGVQPPLILSVEEQKRIEQDWPLPPDADMRIAGGSWGRRRGTRMLLVRECKSGKLVAIFSRQPAELDRVLTRWLESPEGATELF